MTSLRRVDEHEVSACGAVICDGPRDNKAPEDSEEEWTYAYDRPCPRCGAIDRGRVIWVEHGTTTEVWCGYCVRAWYRLADGTLITDLAGTVRVEQCRRAREAAREPYNEPPVAYWLLEGPPWENPEAHRAFVIYQDCTSRDLSADDVLAEYSTVEARFRWLNDEITPEACDEPYRRRIRAEFARRITAGIDGTPRVAWRAPDWLQRAACWEGR